MEGPQLAAILRAVFDATGRRRLEPEEIVKHLSFERRWLPPKTARLAVRAGLASGLLESAGEQELTAGFDMGSVDVPLDFAPDVARLELELASIGPERAGKDVGLALFRRIVRRLAAGTQQADGQVVAAVNQLQAASGGLWTAETAALVHARMQGIDVDDLIAEAESSLRSTARST